MARMPLRMRLCRVPLYVVLRYVCAAVRGHTMLCRSIRSPPGWVSWCAFFGLGFGVGFRWGISSGCDPGARRYSGLGLQPIFFECMADIYALTQQALAGMDVELVDVERAALGLLRVTIDRVGGVRIEDCEQVSRQLSRVFEVENIDYKRLEVGSPGTDRPLRTEAELRRFVGERIEIKLREPLDGRKVFSGTLSLPEAEQGAAGDASAATQPTVFGLEFEAKKNDIQVLSFTLGDVERAKLDPVLDFKGKKR